MLLIDVVAPQCSPGMRTARVIESNIGNRSCEFLGYLKLMHFHCSCRSIKQQSTEGSRVYYHPGMPAADADTGGGGIRSMIRG